MSFYRWDPSSPMSVEEVLYSAMEDFTSDIMIGAGESRSVPLDLPPFHWLGRRLELVCCPIPCALALELRGTWNTMRTKMIDRLCRADRRDIWRWKLPTRRRGFLFVSWDSWQLPTGCWSRCRDFAFRSWAMAIDITITEQGPFYARCGPWAGLDYVDQKILRTPWLEMYGGGPGRAWDSIGLILPKRGRP